MGAGLEEKRAETKGMVGMEECRVLVVGRRWNGGGVGRWRKRVRRRLRRWVVVVLRGKGMRLVVVWMREWERVRWRGGEARG